MSDAPSPGPNERPWFLYETSAGRMTARPASPEGVIACMIAVLMPIAIVAAVLLFLPRNPLIMVGAIFAAVGGSLASLFALIFAKGRRV